MPREILGAGPENLRLFSARLKPHRSLTRQFPRADGDLYWRQYFFISAFWSFGLLGAWPVAGFMGIDVAIFYFAFRANFRAACTYEDVELALSEPMHAKVSVIAGPVVVGSVC